jgi:ADP-dependent NAD(P)H-hydrate dehydratase / NAD(P)H-hydrate epimerase
LIRIAPLDHSHTKAADCYLPVLSYAQIKQYELQLRGGAVTPVLMLQAAQSATRWLLSHVALRPQNQRIIVLCGPGNNGGDGGLIAAALAEAGFTVELVRVATNKPVPSDAQFAWQHCPLPVSMTISNLDPLPDPSHFAVLKEPDLIIDAIFGIGQNRAPALAVQALIDWANNCAATRVAIDLPTGLNPDNGCAFENATGVPFFAQYTLTFIAPTMGLLTGAGRHFCGQVFLDDLSLSQLPDLTNSSAGQPQLVLAAPKPVFSALRRRADSHKGHFGGVFAVGGAPGMTGALQLAARAALLMGAGKVWMSPILELGGMTLCEPSLMTCELKLDAVLKISHNVTLVGPGLGQDKSARQAVAVLLASAKLPVTAIVLDADALNCIAEEKKLALALRRYNGSKVLTPHPLEAARLLGTTTDQVQADRVGCAVQLSKQFDAVVVLKGAGSVITNNAGAVLVVPVGNALLATAGTGDVLAGAIAAFIAQGLSALDAAHAGVVCHGLGASAALAQLPGAIGLTANELIPYMRQVLNQLVVQSHPQ